MSVKNYSGIDANGQNVANTVINLQQNSSDLRNFTIYSNENNIGKSCIVQIRDGNRGDNNNNLVQLTTTHTIVSRTVSGIKVFRAAPFTITDDIIREVFEIDASTSINAYIGQDKDISLTVSVEIGNDTFRFNIGATDYVNVYESPEIAYISHQSNDNKMTVNINITDKSTIIGYGDSDGYDPSNNISYIEVKVTDLESNIQKSKDIYTNSAQNSNDNTFTGPTDTLFGSYTAILNNGDDMPLINGNSYIVNVKVFNGFGKLSNPLDEDLVVKPTNVANAPTNIEVSTKYTDNKTGVDGTNVSVTVDWADTDAPSYRSYSKSGNTIIYNEDSENSYVKLRIGTLEAIEENKNIYSGTTGNFIEKVLTNGDIKNMGSGGTITTSISDVPINNWGNTATTTGIVLNAQILHDTHLDGSNEGDVPQGAVSSQFTGYIQIIPTINDILVAVDVGTGDQTFYFNGTIASKFETGATLTVKNGDATIVDASEIVLVDASISIVEQSVEQGYNDLSDDPTITATIFTPDRNNGSIDNDTDDSYDAIYKATATFETTRFKTPTNKAVATFTGNNGHDDTKLHTSLTSVNNESGNVFDEDESGTNVVWEIYTTSALEDSDKQFNGNYSVSPAPLDAYTFDVTKSYYMKVTKTCTLNFAGTDYNGKIHSSGSSIVTTATVVSDTIGPIYFMQNPTINDILVAVDVGTGDQTFYFNGEVASKDATGATLTVKNGNTTIVSASQIVLVNALMDEQSVEQEYDLLSGNPTITATMTQVDRNGTQDNNSDVYTYTATATFETTRFKTPTNKAVATFTGNNGHDDTKLHTSLTSVNNESGNVFDEDESGTNVVWEIYTTSALEDSDKQFNGNYSVSPAPLDAYTFDVTKSYYMKVTKTCTLNFAGTDYNGKIHSSGSSIVTTATVVSDTIGPIYFMQNPTINDILVAVDVGTGDQTFYFNGEVASKDATGATLTVKNGNTTIVSASQIVLVNALMDEQSVEQEYDLLSGNPTITATMTQVDRNGTQDNNSDVYTYTATATFESYSFKTPTAPEGLAIKNVRGNDNKLIARLNKINNMNGYLHAPGTGANDLAYGVNITAYIKSITSIFNNFEEVSPDFDNGYSDSDENKINLEGSYQVDTEYTIVLRKTAYLPYDEFIKYSGNLHVSSSLDRKSEIETELDAVFYMGNPTLDTTTIIDPTTNKITITGNSHGALFTGTPTDLTLIVVANDSLEAYADGTTVAATGSTVYNKAILLSNNNSISGNEEFSVEISVASGISANAPCICIIDPTNSETSITLINFNNVTLPANSNSATD